MAKKNSKMSAEASDAVVLDLQNRAVMSTSASSNAEIQKKVHQVLEIVPHETPQNIALVLQHYENDVQRSIQALLEDGAKEVLSQWRHSGSKEPKKKRKSKQQQKAQPQKEEPSPSTVSSGGGEAAAAITATSPAADASLDKVTCNGFLSSHEGSTQSSPVQEPPKPPRTVPHTTMPLSNTLPITVPPIATATHVTTTTNVTVPTNASAPTNASVPHTTAPHVTASATPAASIESGSLITSSQSSPVVTPQVNVAIPAPNRPKNLEGSKNNEAKPPHLNVGGHSSTNKTIHPSHSQTQQHHHHHSKGVSLEKATKDLQRQVAALQRLQLRLAETCDNSQKKIALVFSDAKKQLEEKEVRMMYEMGLAKQQAAEMLKQRQQQAAELRKRVDLASAMKDPELHELRADIKHFASERKVDEDLAQTEHFECELDDLLQKIESFSKVIPVQQSYRHRRLSASSVSSSVFSDLTPLSAPTTPLPLPPQPSLIPESSAVKVLGQSDSVTQYEQTGLPKLLQEKKEQQSSGRGYGGRGGYRGHYRGRGGHQGNRGQGQQQQQQNSDGQNQDGGQTRTARRRLRHREKQRGEQNPTRSTQEAGNKDSNPPQTQANSNRGPKSPRRGMGRPGSPRKPASAPSAGNRPPSKGSREDTNRIKSAANDDKNRNKPVAIEEKRQSKLDMNDGKNISKPATNVEKKETAKHVPNGLILDNNNTAKTALSENKEAKSKEQKQVMDKTDRDTKTNAAGTSKNTPTQKSDSKILQNDKELNADGVKFETDGAKPQRTPRGPRKDRVVLSNGHAGGSSEA